MIRYYTAAEIRDIYRTTPAEVTVDEIYRLANEHGWRRARDRQRPALYNADDVEVTMTALATIADGSSLTRPGGRLMISLWRGLGHGAPADGRSGARGE